MVEPLDGVRLLELARTGPAAFCTMMLADMGAEVIKVEMPPRAGAPTKRAISPAEYPTDYEEARRFALNNINRNKRSIGINLKSPRGQEIFQKLAKNADVIVETFRPGVMKRLHCDYDTISKENPRVIYLSLSGYGQSGPYADLPGHDVNYISIGGVLDLIGDSERPPTIPWNFIADLASGVMHGIIGVLLGLIAREKTGKGQHVDVSYLDGVVSLLGSLPIIPEYLLKGVIPKRGETSLSGAYPYYGIYQTKDSGFISLGCMEPHYWRNLCHALGREDLDEYYSRPEHQMQKPAGEKWSEISSWLRKVFVNKTRDEWLEFFRDKDVCIAKVQNVEELLNDPQVKYRRMITELVDPHLGRIQQVGIPIKLSDTPGSIRSLAPVLGQDTKTILEGELGFSIEDIRNLRQNGVIQ